MVSSVQSLISAPDATYGGVVRWGDSVPSSVAGVYAISTVEDPFVAGVDPPNAAPISNRALEALLEGRSELRLDGRRPGVGELAERLAAMWLGDECVVYVGKATSLKKRVGEYYSTPLGARSPHGGGWALKALADIGLLWVHWGTSTRPELAEQYMLARFVDHVSDRSKSTHIDPQRCFPYANLEGPGGRKKHGITGAREPRSHGSRRPETKKPAEFLEKGGVLPPVARGRANLPGHRLRSQRVTQKDLNAGQIRFPNVSKTVFPDEKAEIAVLIRGSHFRGRYDPRRGPDRERSAVLRLGKSVLAGLVEPDEVLDVSVAENGLVSLD